MNRRDFIGFVLLGCALGLIRGLGGVSGLGPDEPGGDLARAMYWRKL